MAEFDSSPRYLQAIRRFDDENDRDPTRVAWEGKEVGREWLYARRLTAEVLSMEPDASEALCLAARCQHLRRWDIPRSGYPADRAGYLRWRKDLQEHHAHGSAAILRAAGYDSALVERVRRLNLKKDLGTDREMQVLEDALCLVFLKFQSGELAAKTDDERMLNALRKSWAKMSERARNLAAAIPLGDGVRELLNRMLGDVTSKGTRDSTALDRQ